MVNFLFKQATRFLFCSFLFITVSSIGQTVDLNNIALQDVKRVASLLDTNTNANSYAIRNSSFTFNNEKINWKKLQLMHLSAMSILQENSNLPMGFNDGSMHPSVGKQNYYNIQIGLQWGRFSLQLAPEKVTAENFVVDGLGNNFDGTANGSPGVFWRRYYEISENVIENPNNPFNKKSDQLFIGQSSLKYHTRHWDIGVSNENLWWGPGINYSLVLTNNAPGFLHYTFNTNKPLKTSLGTIEAQFIGGILENANLPPSENDNPYAARWYAPKDSNNRYVTGMIFTFNPKWTKNLFIGLSNMAYMYQNNMSGLEDATAIGNFSKYTQLKKRPALGSVFLRYALPKDHAEVYVEYGRNDRGATPNNVFYDSVATGYVAGIRKLFLLPNSAKFGAISLNLEVVQLKMPQANLIWTNTLIAKQSSWYTNSQVRQGYTHQGQILGSYVGPGGSGQTMHLAWVKGYNKLGMGIERLSHNKDFYYYNYFNGLTYPGPNFKYWSDFIYTFYIRVKIANFIVSSEIKKTDSYNYLWTKTGLGGLYGPSDTDKSNTQINVSLRYLFTRNY
jgi:hypothetical protein